MSKNQFLNFQTTLLDSAAGIKESFLCLKYSPGSKKILRRVKKTRFCLNSDNDPLKTEDAERNQKSVV